MTRRDGCGSIAKLSREGQGEPKGSGSVPKKIEKKYLTNGYGRDIIRNAAAERRRANRKEAGEKSFKKIEKST